MNERRDPFPVTSKRLVRFTRGECFWFGALGGAVATATFVTLVRVLS